MDSHVDVLGLLYLVWGGLFLLAGAVVLVLALGAVALAEYAGTGAAGTELVAAVTAATFGVLALGALAWGGMHASTGAALRRHRPWSRAAAMVFGVLDLAFLPFGTALGIYALWVLLHDEARARFRHAER